LTVQSHGGVSSAAFPLGGFFNDSALNQDSKVFNLKMDWVFNLFSEYLENDFKKRLGIPKPTVDQLWDAFKVMFPATSARLLVQEPVGNTVRFKPLAFYYADEMGPLIEDAMGYIKQNFGGGKFKINFYQGMQFIATINFKPEGPEIWRDLPELDGAGVS